MLALVLLILANKLPGASTFVRHALLSIPTLNSRLSVGFFMVGIIPALMLPPLLAVTAVNTMQTDRLAQISGSASVISGVLNPLIDKLGSGVTTLAANISATGQLDDAALGGWLLRYHEQNPEFVSTWIANPDGRVISATGSDNGEIGPWEGPKAGVALMDTFAPAVARQGLYVSSVRKGVAPRFDPMMVVSAPIFDEPGRMWGVMQAQLNLRALFAEFIEQESTSSIHTLIVDEKNQVLVASSETGFSPFENLSGHPLITQMSVAGIAASYGFRGTLQEFGDPENFAVARAPLDNGWRVYVIASQEDIERQVLIYLGLLAIWVIIALLLARSLSRIHSDNVAESLRQLEESLHIFDAEQTISLMPSAPKYAPRELKQLYERVRDSMRKSRDAYRDLRRVVTEGEEVRREVQAAAGTKKKRRTEKKDAAPRPQAGKPEPAPPSHLGRIDSVTQLAGLEVFEEFFGEAWVMGGTEQRPLSLVLLSVIPNRISEPGQNAAIEISAIKAAATTTRGKITRTLDLVSRIDTNKLGIVLPDTNLEGALTVGNTVQQAVQDAVGEEYLANAGAVTIVPTSGGNARSFINLAHRALRAAEQQGSEVTFVNSEGKIMLLEEHMVPDGPDDALTLRSGTVAAKNIDEADVTDPASEVADPASKAADAAKESSADDDDEAEEKEKTDIAGGTHVLEWDGGL